MRHALPLVLLTLCCAPPLALALPPYCPSTCDGGSTCSEICTGWGDRPTTCGDYGICDFGAWDWDGDGVPDLVDNCARTHNPSQIDCDGDGVGRACDTFDATVDTLCVAYTLAPGSYRCQVHPDHYYASATYSRVRLQRVDHCGWSEIVEAPLPPVALSETACRAGGGSLPICYNLSCPAIDLPADACADEPAPRPVRPRATRSTPAR